MRYTNTGRLRRSLPLWVGGAIVMGVNTALAFKPKAFPITFALILTGVYAVFGVAFCVWSIQKHNHR